jgi:hypothetical protein
MTPESPTAAPAFDEHLRSAMASLRGALLELMAATNADPASPQDLARRFGVDKSLAWKMSKIAQEEDPVATVSHVPGNSGVRIFLTAFERAGAPADAVNAVKEAVDEFGRVVEIHASDRKTLEMMLGNLDGEVEQQRQESHRKLAYRGNSGMWGVRAKAQLSLNVLMPNADEPAMADLVQVGGLIGFRRLRPSARWLLFRRERWSDDDPHPPMDVVESLDPSYPADKGVPFIGEFSSDPLPQINVEIGEGEEQYELPPGPVGNTAAFTCIYGHVTRKVGPAYADRADEFSEIGCNVTTPVEHLLLDLLVHRDFEWAMRPELLMYSRLDGGAMHATVRRARNIMPIVEPPRDLGWVVGALATPVMPRYSKLVRYVFDRLGQGPADFRAFRFTMTYPPIPVAAIMQSTLPVRSAGER